jgi:hypothetical protein
VEREAGNGLSGSGGLLRTQRNQLSISDRLRAEKKTQILQSGVNRAGSIVVSNDVNSASSNNHRGDTAAGAEVVRDFSGASVKSRRDTLYGAVLSATGADGSVTEALQKELQSKQQQQRLAEEARVQQQEMIYAQWKENCILLALACKTQI